MKLQLLFVISAILLSGRLVEGLKCFTCINAVSNKECNEQGEIVECASNQLSCQNEVRLSEGNKYSITKRCKQTLACENNQAQNDKPAWEPTQCNPHFTNNSVCRCCCDDDLCNERAMPCDKDPKCPAVSVPTNGKVTCNNLNFLESVCSFECNKGYELVGSAVVTCIEYPRGLGWDTDLPRCERSTCGTSELRAPSNGKISCSNSNKISSECSFSCDVGYELKGSSKTTCNLNGQWNNRIPSCSRVFCDSSAAVFLTNGRVFCSDQTFYASVCSYACKEGYKMVGRATAVCQANRRWSNEKPNCNRIDCGASAAIPLDDGTTTCTDDTFFASVCSYQCNRGYRMAGPVDAVCQANGQWTNGQPQCQKITCDIEQSSQVLFGTTVCSESNFYASVCSYFCDEGYYRIGSETTVCEEDGQWTEAKATCAPITCNNQDLEIRNGAVTCSRENFYGSTCNFECDRGYYMDGGLTTVCQGDFLWSSPAPVCRRETCGPELFSPAKGGVVCTENNLSFSECTYVCGDGSSAWEMFGPNKTTCDYDEATKTFEWTDLSTPCCAKKCPPYAQVDMFLVLDSSSSVGKENWNKTVYFIKDIIDNFVISQDDMLVAAIRYNKFVDTASEIKIGQYTTQKETTDAIINLPYDGSGTLTGNALDYVLRNMLVESGNRPDVQDLVFVVTDGISKDDVTVPAGKIREAGANVVALGVVNEGGSLKREDIADIAGDPEKTVLIDTGFEGLSFKVVDLILKQVCGNPCDRQNQYSGIAAAGF